MKSKNTKSLFIIYFLNLKLALRNKSIIITGLIFICISSLFIIMQSLSSSYPKMQLMNLSLFKAVSYICSGFCFSIFLTLIAFFFFKKQKDDGIQNIELRAGIPIWQSFLYRYSLALFISIFYVLINFNLGLLFTLISSYEQVIIKDILLTQLAFYFFLPIVLLPFIIAISMTFSVAIGILNNLLLALIIFIYPFGAALSTQLNGSINKISETSYMNTNINMHLGHLFYNSLKNNDDYKDIFEETEINFRYDSFEKEDIGDIEKRAFLNGQANLFNGDQKILSQYKIAKLIDIIYESSKEIDTYNNSIENQYWLLSEEAWSDKQVYIKIKPTLNHLKTQLPELFDLFNWVEYIYDNYLTIIKDGEPGGINGLAYSIFKKNPLIIKNTFKFEDEKLNSEENNEVFKVYKKNPEIMIINWIILSGYRASMYNDFNNSDNDILSIKNNGINYNSEFKSNNSSANGNFFNNWWYIYRGNNTKPFVNDYVSSISAMMQPTKALKYYSKNDIEEIIRRTKKSEEKISNQDLSLYKDLEMKLNGGFNITVAVICWITFSAVLIYLNSLIYKKKSKI
ncbi:ABC-2 transporter permease [Spiroplasma cantharicola]|uniref:ABC transporter permease n=1 Tax=Spiroplasma cantharicola TaxID=362837 RepID=A0A0M4JW27_9MOLU|nr:ABC transporter permease [Spiroplasma cantharicola]ALD66080.1 hypothetical protein SCANT_v1c01700 [Spiroplasma cantharicola]